MAVLGLLTCVVKPRTRASNLVVRFRVRPTTGSGCLAESQIRIPRYARYSPPRTFRTRYTEGAARRSPCRPSKAATANTTPPAPIPIAAATHSERDADTAVRATRTKLGPG